MQLRYGFAMTAVLLSLAPGRATVKTREVEYRRHRPAGVRRVG
jgi:hypothetical protein